MRTGARLMSNRDDWNEFCVAITDLGSACQIAADAIERVIRKEAEMRREALLDMRRRGELGGW